jgi:hypothetical protein
MASYARPLSPVRINGARRRPTREARSRTGKDQSMLMHRALVA